MPKLALGVLVALDVAHRIVVSALGPGRLEKDALGYWRFGGDVAGGDLFLRHSEQVFRVPGYPWFVGLMRALFDDLALGGIVVAQHAFGIATSLLAAWLAYRCCRSPLAMTAAYLLSAASPARVVYANMVMSETLFAFLLTATFAALLVQAEQPEALGRPVLSGVLLGLTTLVRPVTQLLPAVVLLALFFQPRPGGARRLLTPPGLRAFGILLVGYLLTLSPWLARDAEMVGQPTLTKALGRQCWVTTFGTTVSAAALELPESAEAGVIARAVAAHGGAATHNFSVFNALTRGAGMKPWEADELMQRVCLEAIRRQPAAYSRSLLSRLRVFWTATGRRTAGEMLWPPDAPPAAGGRYERLVSALYRPSPWLTLIYSLAAWAGAVLLLARRSHRHLGAFVLGTLIYFSLVSTIFGVPLYRYRMPLEPLLAVCIAGLIAAAAARRGRAGGGER